jgi:hypothetical protein
VTREERKIRAALDLLIAAGFLIEGKLDAGKLRANYFGAEVALRQLKDAIQSTNNALGHIASEASAPGTGASPGHRHAG